jgi:uncharacterized protein (DUF169 family)
MDLSRLAPAPVGVRVLASAQEADGVPVYHGVSYCDAVREAGEGAMLRVMPGSIKVCGWAPVVLGLKKPDSRFEEGLVPRLPFPVTGLLLARLEGFPGEPDVVVVRARPEVLQDMVQHLPDRHAPGPHGVECREQLWDGHEGHLDRSAIPALIAQRSPARRALIGSTNRALAALARSRRWQALTHWLFRSHLVTVGFDALISRTLADMSVCRNSTAIPLLTGQTNLSFFCTGGITWGHNDPGHLTSGWPWANFLQATQGTAPSAEGAPSEALGEPIVVDRHGGGR